MGLLSTLGSLVSGGEPLAVSEELRQNMPVNGTDLEVRVEGAYSCMKGSVSPDNCMVVTRQGEEVRRILIPPNYSVIGVYPHDGNSPPHVGYYGALVGVVSVNVADNREPDCAGLIPQALFYDLGKGNQLPHSPFSGGYQSALYLAGQKG